VFVLSVCPLVTTVHCAKTADSIVMPFLAVGQMGSSISVLDGGPDPFMHDGAIFFVGGDGMAQCNVWTTRPFVKFD